MRILLLLVIVVIALEVTVSSQIHEAQVNGRQWTEDRARGLVLHGKLKGKFEGKIVMEDRAERLMPKKKGKATNRQHKDQAHDRVWGRFGTAPLRVR